MASLSASKFLWQLELHNSKTFHVLHQHFRKTVHIVSTHIFFICACPCTFPIYFLYQIWMYFICISYCIIQRFNDICLHFQNPVWWQDTPRNVHRTLFTIIAFWFMKNKGTLWKSSFLENMKFLVTVRILDKFSVFFFYISNVWSTFVYPLEFQKNISPACICLQISKKHSGTDTIPLYQSH